MMKYVICYRHRRNIYYYVYQDKYDVCIMTHVLSNRCRIFFVTRNPLKRKNEFTPIVVDVLNVDGIVFNHYKINKLDKYSLHFHL